MTIFETSGKTKIGYIKNSKGHTCNVKYYSIVKYYYSIVKKVHCRKRWLFLKRQVKVNKRLLKLFENYFVEKYKSPSRIIKHNERYNSIISWLITTSCLISQFQLSGRKLSLRLVWRIKLWKRLTIFKRLVKRNPHSAVY